MLYPPARGFDEDLLVQYPCGGQNTVQDNNRTQWPTTGAPIQLDMHHPEAMVEILIAYGNNPSGDDFQTILVPTFQEIGPRNFCVGNIVLGNTTLTQPGMNATIMSMTNGDPNGGLYNCADVTFTDTPMSSAMYTENCVNSDGVSRSTIANADTTNANGTTVAAGDVVSSALSSSAAASTAASTVSSASATGAVASTTSGAAASASPSSGAEKKGVVGAAVVGVAAVVAAFV